MSFELIKLPFEENELEPFISKETLRFHYDKHHRNYLINLNKLLKDQELKYKTIEDIIMNEVGSVFNNAAQVFNHNFYWQCMSKNFNQIPVGNIAFAINKKYGSFNKFKEKFTKAAIGLFGSGWVWLISLNKKIEIITTSNAGCPIRYNKKPLLVLDVWEHAYYIDYRNSRAEYIKSWWSLVNWSFLNKNFNI